MASGRKGAGRRCGSRGVFLRADARLLGAYTVESGRPTGPVRLAVLTDHRPAREGAEH
ncbi:MAG: hypothetical protein ACLS63_10805 [Flavonifractor plautii]